MDEFQSPDSATGESMGWDARSTHCCGDGWGSFPKQTKGKSAGDQLKVREAEIHPIFPGCAMVSEMAETAVKKCKK